MNEVTAPTKAGPARPPILPVGVRWRERTGEERSESSQLLNATPRSATLTLEGQPELGQLLCLTLPGSRASGSPPTSLWALVWATAEATGVVTAGPRHNVSVVFLSEEVPHGREGQSAPLFAYMAEDDGRFRLQRMMADALGQQDKRRESRVSIPVEVTLELLDDAGTAVNRELTVTENLSRRGAAVWTSLPAAEGQRVRLSSNLHGVTLTALVRRARAGRDGITRLHLEFADGRWPLERFN